MAQTYLHRLPVGGLGLTVNIELVSVQIGLNWNWPTGTELGNNIKDNLRPYLAVLIHMRPYLRACRTNQDNKGRYRIL